jgi:hypothetical protein
MAYYPRPAFMQAGIETESVQMMFSTEKMVIPKIDYPVSPIENFRLAAERRTPFWVPNPMLDYTSLMSATLNGAFASATPWGDRMDQRANFLDEWGCKWEFVPEAGGAMLDPKSDALLDDITNWEKAVKFPDSRSMDWKTAADDFMKNKYDPKKVLNINIGQGCTERFVALLGGYTEAMLAMAEEPEACADFFMRFADWEIEQFDVIKSLYPVNIVTYHDDWGTERDTFFSESMMERLVLEPSRKIISHIKDSGTYFELHSCGNIGRFINYMIDLNIDFLQIQARANDIPAMKRKYGDKIGFCCYSDYVPSPDKPQSEHLAHIRSTVDTFGKHGGMYATVGGYDDKSTWDAVFELYCYSREFYDIEREE